MAHPIGTGSSEESGPSWSAREQGEGPSTPARERTQGGGPLTAREVELMDAYWRACNYLAVGMIYLQDNPLLHRPLVPT
ncbi:MAG: hypothetical protein EOO72_03765, partial [Myxococcaceae bacterium]